MRLLVVGVIVAFALSALPLGMPAVPASASSGSSGGPLGIVGDLEAPSGRSARVLTGTEFEAGVFDDLGHLVLDRAAFEKAKAQPRLGSAINAFAKGRPVTFVGVGPTDLGLTGLDQPGLDRRMDYSRTTAVSVVEAGGVLFRGVHTWDGPVAKATIVAEADAWWRELTGRYPQTVSIAAETYSGFDWQLKASNSYSYSSYPHGVLKYWADWYRNVREDNPTSDYWAVVMDTSTDPGRNVWGTSWRTSWTQQYSDIDLYEGSGWHHLHSWGPGSTWNLDWIAWNLDVANGVMSNSYSGFSLVDSISYSSATWNGDSWYEIRHYVDYGSSYANGGYTSEPGFIVQIPAGTCVKIPFTNRATWHDYSTGSGSSTWINSWREVCP